MTNETKKKPQKNLYLPNQDLRNLSCSMKNACELWEHTGGRLVSNLEDNQFIDPFDPIEDNRWNGS